jgi:hypothetical protein
VESSWLRDEPARPNPWRWRRRGIKAAAALSVVLLLVDLNRDAERCEQDCYGTYRTYEPGHAWTNYPDAWQWDAQNAIAGVAFVLGVASYVFLLADRRRRAVWLAVASAALIVAWLTWVALSPARG